jgi:hypothetical protein
MAGRAPPQVLAAAAAADSPGPSAGARSSGARDAPPAQRAAAAAATGAAEPAGRAAGAGNASAAAACGWAEAAAADSPLPQAGEAAAKDADMEAGLPEWAQAAVRDRRGALGRSKPWKVVLTKEQVLSPVGPERFLVYQSAWRDVLTNPHGVISFVTSLATPPPSLAWCKGR